MNFEWDEQKNKQNRRKHGIDFEEASEIFEGPILSWVDDRIDYGEIREISIGMIQNSVIIIVVHTERGNKIRIISARKATFMERLKYYAYLQETSGRDSSDSGRRH